MTDPPSPAHEGPHRSNGPPAEDVRLELDRILTSPVFAQSGRLRKFLRFVVEETLAGRAGALKEYTIGIDVFERDESFDPQTSSIVRVEASWLRGKLKEYHAAGGRDAQVHIVLPTGSYVPTFRAIERDRIPQAEPAGAGRLRRLAPAWAALAVITAVAAVLGLAVGAFALFGPANVEPGRDTPAVATQLGAPYSIAVLPLRNLSGMPEEDYFSDGMTDALITGLARQQSLRVTSLTSAMVYKNVSRPIADIARELNVNLVIEGSILRSGDRVRITAQLVDVTIDRHVWSESYERDVADVLAIQDDVARRIVAALSGRVDAVAATRSKAVSAIDPAAHEAYLKGRYFRNQMTEDGFRKGIAYFEQAIEKEPRFAAAYSGIAACYCLLGGHGFELVEPALGMPAAKESVLQALELDDSMAEPHAFLGIIRLKYEWDWPAAEEAFRRAIQLNPSFAQAHLFYSFFLEAMGRQGEAIREAEAARVIDPLSLAVNVNLAWQYLRAGQLKRAMRQLESTDELQSGFWGVHWGRGHYYRRTGNYDAAIEAFEEAVDVGGGHTLPLTDLGYTYAIAGRTLEARAVLDRLAVLAETSYVSPYNSATIHMGLGDIDEAFAWLEKAFEGRSRSMAWLMVAPEYDGARSDPRFKSLVRRIGLPQ